MKSHWTGTRLIVCRADRLIYAQAADGLGVIDNVTEAVACANDLIARATR
jgi:hypothetical protein